MNQPLAPLPEAVVAGWEEHVLERPQGPLRYVLAGSGPPLVLCHGFIGSAENFESWVARLAPHRLLVMPDLPGFGGSAPLPTAHRSRALAGEVRALLDHLEIQKFEAGGLCLGAAVAMELLAAAPARVGQLLLHTPLLTPRMVNRPFRLQVRALTAPGAFDLISAIGRWRPAADLYRRVVVEGSTPADRRSADVNFENQLRASPRAAREWLREGISLDFAPLLMGWEGDIQVLAATDDRILNVELLRRFCQGRPRTELSLVEAAGHGWTPEFMSRQLEILERAVSATPSTPR
jgi:pimeloyl-ACP methyl ester carboxylesterase